MGENQVESEAISFITVILGAQIVTSHAQIVRIGATDGCSRPPVAGRALKAQAAIAPVIVARCYIRKRILTGVGRAGGVLIVKIL